MIRNERMDAYRDRYVRMNANACSTQYLVVVESGAARIRTVRDQFPLSGTWSRGLRVYSTREPFGQP
jgi:hypothetical protein